jgi:hypothetical protein
MAANNRSGKSGQTRGSSRGRRTNNNPEGRNQHSGLRGTARDNPLAAAAAVGTAVAAGVFLWSRRNQISDQIANLSEQIGEWRESSQSVEGFDEEGSHSGVNGGGGRSQAEIAEEALTLKEIGKAGT